MKIKLTKKITGEVLKIALASVLFAISINMFLSPSEVIIGGVTGIATVVNILSGGFAPIGVTMVILNIPLVIVTWIKFGHKFIAKTAVGTLTSALTTDLLTLPFFRDFFPEYTLDPLLCAIFGGVLMGASLGIYFSMGYTTGGTDLLIMLIRNKWKRISTGTISMIIDSVIIAVSLVVLDALTTALLSVTVTYIAAFVMDKMIFGATRSKMTIIISDKNIEIAAKIASDLERGVTVLEGRGYWHGEPCTLLICAIPPRQAYDIKRIVYGYDPAAFVIFAEASEVIGEGFVPAGDFMPVTKDKNGGNSKESK